MKKSTFLILALTVCVLSVTLTICIVNITCINDEDKVLINTLENDDDSLERQYTYSRTYVLKDGTLIKGSGGNCKGKRHQVNTD